MPDSRRASPGTIWSQGRASTPSELLRFLDIQATLDYSELEPGLNARPTPSARPPPISISPANIRRGCG